MSPNIIGNREDQDEENGPGDQDPRIMSHRGMTTALMQLDSNVENQSMKSAFT